MSELRDVLAQRKAPVSIQNRKLRELVSVSQTSTLSFLDVHIGLLAK